MGAGVETFAGVGPDGFGPGCSFTSLGTITLLPLSGTFGRPASAPDVSAPAGVWGGGGSPPDLVAHAENNHDAAATINDALIVFFAIPAS